MVKRSQLLGSIRVGTASWSEPDFVRAGWYPKGLPPSGARLSVKGDHEFLSLSVSRNNPFSGFSILKHNSRLVHFFSTMLPTDSDLKVWLPILTWLGSLAIAFIGGGFALTRWIHEVRENRALRAQELKWKQKEAMLKQILAFGDTPGAYNAVLMLGSPDREIPLWDRSKREECYVRVTWEEVAEAMAPKDAPLPPKLSAIRDSIGDFLGRLTHMELYRSASLINNEDVKAQLSPWTMWLALDKPHARNIRLHIRYRGLWAVEKLLKEATGLDIATRLKADELAYTTETNHRLDLSGAG